MPVPDRRRTSAEQDQAVADRAQTAAVSCPIEASLRPTPRLGRRRREKAGIPVTPRALASAMSASMGACCAACRGPARNASCRAQLSRVLQEEVALDLGLIAEHIVVELPELPLLVCRHGGDVRQGASLWMSSGSCFQTMRTLSPYTFRICSRVGPTLPQNGHWKSENSTIVTGAPAGPCTGAPSVLTV